MKSLLFLFGGLMLGPVLTAQTFTEAPQTPPFMGVRFSALAFADVNGDEHQDVLVTGLDGAGEGSSKLYLNDGSGNFMEVADAPFQAVAASALAFADVNGDAHVDVLITGVERFSATERVAKLYTNDGLGHFTEVPNTPFEGVWFGSANFADVNGDGAQDVLITGQDTSDQRLTQLFTNDGSGNFTALPNTPFDSVRFSSVAFADVNGDDHLDVLITGQNNAIEPIAKLYTNDGSGNFTEVADAPFTGVWESSAAFTDVNGDEHQDVLITGTKGSGMGFAKLYTNDGAGNFTEMMDTPFDGVWRSAIAFADVNGDDHPDVLLAGEDSEGQRVTKLYTNDGAGDFTEVSNTPFAGLRFGTVTFADANSDGYPDVFLTGENSANELIAKLYTNDGETSTIEEVFDESTLDFTLYPNPVAAQQLNVRYQAAEDGRLSLKIYGALGQLLHHLEKDVLLGPHLFSVDIASFASGTYWVEVQAGRRRGTGTFVIP